VEDNPIQVVETDHQEGDEQTAEGTQEGRMEKKEKKTCLKDGKGIYVGESSRSLYERAKEHEADKVKTSEDSHQIKHWLTDHTDLMAPPKFRFAIIKSFKDPLSRQLSEAVRIDLRGENILNSKTEYSRCRVPRLTVDLEGWTTSKKVEAAAKVMVPAQVQQEDELLAKEAEESLEEREIKRKREETQVMGEKNKRRKLEKLTGWSENTEDLENPITLQEEVPIILEVTSIQQEDTSTRQEKIETREIQTQKNITKQGSKQKAKQTSIKS
jgi:Uri superfamily endonuclease